MKISRVWTVLLAAPLFAVLSCSAGGPSQETSPQESADPTAVSTSQEALTKCAGGANGAADYCDNASCKCGVGEGDCDLNTQCQTGLVCGVGLGAQFGQNFNNDVCVPSHCTNKTRDADETGTDCGGADCGSCVVCGGVNGSSTFCQPLCKCSSGQGNCTLNTQCQTGLVCGVGLGAQFGQASTNNVCVRSHCINKTQDVDETGTDCGGADCGTCITCSGTNGNINFCTNQCPCSKGQGNCTYNSQCQSGLVCGLAIGAQFGQPSTNNVCVPSHCTNKTRDADETGTDCGGADCGTCVNCTGTNGSATFCTNQCQCAKGQGNCSYSSQCQSGLFCGVGIGSQFGQPSTNNVCVPSHCLDEVQDADETGLDCGGADCGSCVVCGGTNGDSSFCTTSCKCNTGQGDCDLNAECQTGLVCGLHMGAQFGQLATNDVCVPLHCTNAAQDGDETGIDCGGADCGSCPVCVGNNGEADFCTSGCKCDKGQGDCDINAECKTGLVCGATLGPQFGLSASTDVCVPSHCTDRIKNSDESGIDCGGADCGVCQTCPTNGLSNTCSPTCKCAVGWGDCDSNYECQSGLVCGTAIGARYGINASFDVCTPSHCLNGAQDTASGEQGIDCGGDCGPCNYGSTSPTSCSANDLNICGSTAGENCCAAPKVTGGGFTRNYDGVILTNAYNKIATVANFNLDKFELTVGRFRKFVAAYDAWRGAGNPSTDAGAHPLIAKSGWQTTWTSKLPTDAAALATGLKCDPSWQTWTDSPGTNETRPINCITWYEAFAFCLWDGGRLPTEAEWNYAASGGTNHRVYPWSSPYTSSAVDGAHLSYGCAGGGSPGTCTIEDIVTSGALTAGYGRWGHAELSGNLWEFTLDYWSTTLPYPCTNCANVTTASGWRAIHGGSWVSFAAANLAAAHRDRGNPTGRAMNIGFRCARD